MSNITSTGALVLGELCTFVGVVLPIIHWLTVGRGNANYSLVNSSRDVPLAYTAEPFATRTVYSKWPNNLIEIHQDGCSYQPSYAPGAGELKLEAAWLHIWSSYTTPCLPAPPPSPYKFGGY